MTKVYGTGAYDFKRHRVAEYPVDPTSSATQPAADKPVESALPSTITLLEIQRDRLTKIAEDNWSKAAGGGGGGGKDSGGEKQFDPELV